MKEGQKQFLNTVKAGLVKLLKIIWIVLKSFFEAITWDFYDNIRKYWKKDLKPQEKPAVKTEEQPKP